jgi:hypothetical protein
LTAFNTPRDERPRAHRLLAARKTTSNLTALLLVWSATVISSLRAATLGAVTFGAIAFGATTLAATTVPALAQSGTPSPIGTNLSGVNYYSTEQPFLNLFKNGSLWVTGSYSRGVWDTAEQSKIALDVNGWPTSVTAGAGGQPVTYDHLGVLLQRGFGTPYYPGGQYVVLYEGTGTILYSFDALKNVALSAPGRDVIDVTPGDNGIYVQIAATDPQHTGDYIRNIRVVQASYESLLAQGEIFSPTFVSRLKPFKMLRFMDWMQTNSSTQSTVENRATPTKAFWGDEKGVPVEVMVALANKIGADAWFNMPHMATYDYCAQFAAYVHRTLGSTQKVYIEYSNETWNGIFSQAQYMATQGHIQWPSAPADFQTGRSFYGMRTAQMSDIWKNAWGADRARVVTVLGTQTGNYGVATLSLDAVLWVGNSVRDHVDALGITGYFGSPVPAAWTSQPDGGLTNLFNEALYGGIDPNGYPGGDLQKYIDWAKANKQIADNYGLRLVAYEGGSGYTDMTGNSALVALYINANVDARMRTLYSTFLSKWQQATGGAPFNQYNDIGKYSAYGSWGALQNLLYASSPKYDALLKYIAAGP